MQKIAECTEGGEALTPITLRESDTSHEIQRVLMTGSWYAIWTHSHCEKSVHDQLVEKGYGAFLPKIDVWSRRRGVRRLISAPMFPSYLFLRAAIDKATYIDVSKVRGVTQLLGERWDRLISVPDEEMRAIEMVDASRQPVLPYPYLKQGQRARITSGPLSGVEGILVENRQQQGLLVLSIHLLHRSIAVVVDGTAVEPM